MIKIFGKYWVIDESHFMSWRNGSKINWKSKQNYIDSLGLCGGIIVCLFMWWISVKLILFGANWFPIKIFLFILDDIKFLLFQFQGNCKAQTKWGWQTINFLQGVKRTSSSFISVKFWDVFISREVKTKYSYDFENENARKSKREEWHSANVISDRKILLVEEKIREWSM